MVLFNYWGQDLSVRSHGRFAAAAPDSCSCAPGATTGSWDPGVADSFEGLLAFCRGLKDRSERRDLSMWGIPGAPSPRRLREALMATLNFATDHCFYERSGDYDTLMVLFNYWGQEISVRSHGRYVAAAPCNKVYIHSGKNDWFQNGIPEVANSFEELLAFCHGLRVGSSKSASFSPGIPWARSPRWAAAFSAI